MFIIMCLWGLVWFVTHQYLTDISTSTGVFKTHRYNLKIKWPLGTSPLAQWLRILLPMQGTWVRSLVWEDPTCHGATKPVCHNYWACALEPASHNYWAHAPQLLKPVHSRAHVPQLLSPCAATTDACAPRTCAPQQEKPPQWEAHALQRRVAPTHCN